MFYGKVIADEIQEKIYSLFLNGETIEKISSQVNFGTHVVKKVIRSKSNSNLTITELKSLKNKNVNEQITQCIYGSLLGDSSLSKKYSKNNFVSFAFCSSHCNKQKNYLIKKSKVLGVKPRTYIKGDNSWSPNSKYWTLSYHNKLFLQNVYDQCFINNVKTVSAKWVNVINWEGIAYWFMDDGCSHAYKNAQTIQVNFSTLSFSKSEIDLLISKFKSLGVATHTVKSQHGKGMVLAVDSKDVNFFMSKIEPFIVPCMKYKIKKDKKKWT
jgi:hypothetical protein